MSVSYSTHALFCLQADADEHDGTFNIWWGTRSSGVKLLEKVDLNIALSYEYVGAAMDEMNSGKKEVCLCVCTCARVCGWESGSPLGGPSLSAPTVALALAWWSLPDAVPCSISTWAVGCWRLQQVTAFGLRKVGVTPGSP